jgi:type IX secretion system PorP/SprF family membrane protein
MKRILTLVLLVMFALRAGAQQAPFHKHYFVNPFIANPAMVGLDDRMNLFLMHRSQWASLPGAPVTSTMTFDSPIKDGTNGFGLTFFTDQTDIFRRTGGSINYGHHFNFGKKITLSAGVGVNAFDNRIDFSKVVVLQQTDPYAFQSVQNKAVLDGSGGMNLRIQRFNLGASLSHFGVPGLRYTDANNEANYRQEMFAQGVVSYQFLLGGSGKIGIKPMVAFRYFDASPYQFDGNLILSYDDKVWAAGTYNSDYGFSASAGITIYDQITVGYSYDIITNTLAGMTGMSSELIVGIKLGRTKAMKEAEFLDADNDGVADEFDKEPNTKPGAFVNFQGITIKDKLGIEDFDTLVVKEIVYLDSTLAEPMNEGGGGVPAASSGVDNNYRSSIYFDFDRSNVNPGEDSKIVEIVRELEKNSDAKIVITGHADRKGSEEYNMMLGQKRAQSIAEILVNDFNISPTKIVSVISKGKSDPLSQSRAYVNRRVDVEIVSGNMNIPTIQTPEGPSATKMKVDKEAMIPMEKAIPKVEKLADQSVSNLLDHADDGLFFTIQLGVFKNDVTNEYWKNVQPLFQMELEDGSTRYYSGQYTSKEKAQSKLKEMQSLGFNDAFPTAYYKGQRITLEKAAELLEGIGPNILKEQLR